MTIRTDISVNWETSPRIVLIAAPSTEVTIQDLYDTLRSLETDQLDEPSITNGSGKEPLGGGVYVGLTISLLNAQLAFESRSGPSYVQCSVSGGNLVAFDVDDNEMSAIYPTAFTQIIKTSSASATLQESADIQFSSFNGCVAIDVLSPHSGTLYPVGTLRAPVNNLTDAVAIASARGFSTLQIIGDITITAGDDVSDYLIKGSNATRTFILIEDASETSGLEIQDAIVTGVLDGNTIIKSCYVFDLEYINGYLYDCELAGTIRLGGNSTAHIMHCFAEVNHVTIDMNYSLNHLNVQMFSGDLIITNKQDSSICCLHLTSGSVTLEESVTDSSNIHIAGIGLFNNNSGLTGITTGLLSVNAIMTDSRALTISKFLALK